MQHTAVDVFANTPAPPIHALPEKSLLSPADHLWAEEKSSSDSLGPSSKVATKSTIKDNVSWHELGKIRLLARGGSSLVYSATYHGRPVVVKTLRPKIRESDSAMSDIESELVIISHLDHANIVKFIGAGLNNSGDRFLVFEKLDGGTLSQRLGFESVRSCGKLGQLCRKKKRMPYHDALEHARSLALAMQYLHEKAMPNAMVLHRDLKPDNIAFSMDGTVKLLDFGLARVLENGNPKSNEVYTMSGETGSLRYMAPEVAQGEPYNHKADVYSFGIILWEMFSEKKSFCGLKTEEEYFGFVVQRGVRPPLSKEWPVALCSLISDCWDSNLDKRPDFQKVIMRLDSLLSTSEDKRHKKSNGVLHRIKRCITKAA